MTEYVYCEFWRRITAALVDIIIILLILISCLTITNVIADILKIDFYDWVAIIVVIFILTLSILLLCYAPKFESSEKQATLGCYFLDMKIINIDGSQITFIKSCVRMIIIYLTIVTIIPMIISLFYLVFSNGEKTLHDIICKTRIVRR